MSSLALATDSGSIPPGWVLKRIGEIAPLQRGFDLPAQSLRDGPFPVVYSNGVLRHHEKFMVKGPGVVTGRSGTIGRVHYVEQDFWPHNTSLWVTSFFGNDAKFVFYLYSHVDFSRFLSGTGVPTLNRNDVHAQQVPLPPPSEQRAIAAALSDADALIAALEALIAKKRALKQGAMQQILTGRTRLPGFTREWGTKRISDLTEIDSENLAARTPSDFSFNYISLEQVDRGRLVGWTEEKFGTAPSRARRVLRKHDVLVATVRPNLQSHFLYDGMPERAVCSTGFAVLRCRKEKAAPGFVYAHFFARPISGQIERILAGSNYPAINRGEVGQLEISCPEVEEQHAIATVLGDMDAEISALEHRCEKMRALKEGMMQSLLSGRVRLLGENQGAPA